MKSPGRRRNRVVRVSMLGVCAGAIACTSVDVDLRNRPCKEGTCLAGYVCNSTANRCGRWLGGECEGGGMCPSDVETGSHCRDPGSFLPCAEGATACEAGCRTCLENERWSECRTPDCEIGRPNACAGCEDDCNQTVKNASATCDGPPYRCGYSGCDLGWVDADTTRSNGCECRPDCTGRCAGPDGCGGTCPDTCVAPETCGGGGATDACGCTPDCTGRCAGPDSCGGVCEAACPDDQICGAVTPYECGCCPGWWHCGYAGRTLLRVEAVDALPAGFSIEVSFDHAQSVAEGETLASGDDLRVVFWTGGAWAELDRVLDPESSWGSRSTTVWFPLYRAIAAGSYDDYQVYTTNPSPSPPLADEDEVFAFADFFDRAGDLGDGDGWSVTESADNGSIDIVNGALAFTQTFDDHYNRPMAQHDFQSLSGGFELRTSVTWDRPGSDTCYWLFVELGQADAMYVPADAYSDVLETAGVGPTPAYGGGLVDGVFRYGFGFHDYDTVLVRTGVTANESLFSAAGSTTSGVYNLYVDGARVSNPVIPFADATISRLDRIRIMAWSNASDEPGDQRRLDYVLLRRTVEHGPKVSLGAEQTRPCP